MTRIRVRDNLNERPVLDSIEVSKQAMQGFRGQFPQYNVSTVHEVYKGHGIFFHIAAGKKV